MEDRVEKGDFAFGLTDNDDGMAAVRESRGKKMMMVFPDEQGLGLLAPDAPVLIKNGPHSENGKKFIDFMLRPETEIELAKIPSQIPLRPDLPPSREYPYPPFEQLRGMRVDLQRTCGPARHARAGLPEGMGGSESKSMTNCMALEWPGRWRVGSMVACCWRCRCCPPSL